MTRVDAAVALIMTVLNEADTIGQFLRSLEQQTVLPGKVVIVDGGSIDSTVSRIREWTPPGGVEVLLEARPGANISAGRNAAVTLAASQRLLVTDAGTVLSQNWVEQLAKALEDADVASGFFEPLRGGFVATAIGATITPHISEIRADRFLPSSRSVGFRMESWLRVGGYPEWLDYCEDLVFDLALKKSGARFAFVPAAVAGWDARPTLRAFAKQYYRYARGDGQALLWGRRHVIRYAAYVGGAVLLAGAVRMPLLLIPFFALAALYLQKSYRRLLRFRELVASAMPLAALLVPIVVVVGDVAKMLGYPAGRIRRRRSETESGIDRSKPTTGFSGRVT